MSAYFSEPPSRTSIMIERSAKHSKFVIILYINNNNNHSRIRRAQFNTHRELTFDI